MTTSNQINANTAGIITYDGAGNFGADTTTNHNVLIGAASNGITNLAPGAVGTALVSTGASADPAFQVVPGIGITVTNHSTLIGGASNSITSLALGTSGQVLTSNGAGADPSYQALPGATGIQTLTDGSANVVSPSGGTITFTNGQNVSNLSGSANHITFDVTGTTNHAVQVGNSSGNLTSLAIGTSGQPLLSAGAGSNPAYGNLAVPAGGTGAVSLTGVLTGNGTSPITASTVTQHGVVIAAASNAVSSVGPGASGTVLSGNTGADPTFQVVPGIGTTVTQHDVLVGGASNNIVSVSPSSAGLVLASNGVSADPSFQTVPGVGNTVTQYATLLGGASNSIVSLSPIGSAGQVLTSNGAGANPSYQSLPSTVLTVDADSGSATPSGGAITLSGGTTGLTTSASAATVDVTGTLNVGHGGTGLTATSPYALLAGGTSGAGNLQQVSGVGSAGQILVSNGAGALPSWQNSASGQTYVLLNTQTISNQATVSFGNAYFTNLYTSYAFTFNNIEPAGGATQFIMKLSTNNGSTFLSSLNTGTIYHSWNSASWSNTSANATTSYVLCPASFASLGFSGTMNLIDFGPNGVTPSYAGTFVTANQHIMAYGDATGAVNFVQFLANSGNLATGKISLYGIAT